MARFELAPWKSQFPFARGGREPYSLFRREFDRLFEDFFGAPATNGGEEGAVAPSLAPRLDIAETENAYAISAELPGVEEKDLDVAVADGVLTIKGEKRSESEEKDEEKNYHRVERSYARYERRLTLPQEVDQSKIDAAFRNGVLTVTIPKTKAASEAVRKIAIKSN